MTLTLCTVTRVVENSFYYYCYVLVAINVGGAITKCVGELDSLRQYLWQTITYSPVVRK